MILNYDGFLVYQKYVLIKLHFTDPNYSYIKYRGASRTINKDTFLNRKDKSFFEHLAVKLQKSDIMPFFIANFVDGPDIWVGDLIYERESLSIYKQWKAKIYSLNEVIVDDIKNVKNLLDKHSISIKQFIIPKSKTTPTYLLKLFLEKMIYIETFILLMNKYNLWNEYDDIYSSDFIWPSISHRCKKYEEFIHSTLEKISVNL